MTSDEVPSRFKGLRPLVYWNLAYGSFYDPALRLHYIATPKAACTTLKWWFADLENVHPKMEYFRYSGESTPELLVHDLFAKAAPHIQSYDLQGLDHACADSSAYRFAIVRNPYVRIFSSWLSKLAVQEANQIAPYREAKFMQIEIVDRESISMAFESFIRYLADREAPNNWQNVHWTPQIELLVPDKIAYSQIFKVESMPELVHALGKHLADLGHNMPPFGRYNEGLLRYADNYLTPTSIALIAELYAADFEAYGYDPQHVPQGHPISDAEVRASLTGLPQVVGRNKRLGDLHQILMEELEAHAVTDADRKSNVSIVQAQQAELDQLYRLKESKDQEIIHLQEVQNRMGVEIADSQGIRQLLNQEIISIRSSNSWKITRPLRRAADYIRKFRPQ
jgi:hypothetical protein